MIKRSTILFLFISSYNFCFSQTTSAVWLPDNGDGTYNNPVINADYSDPDAIRVGDDYYMIASSFTCVPGLPILHSNDLVNWQLIGYALNKLQPEQHFNEVQPGGGVWAPSIRYHNNEFYIYYPDPDFGIYLIKAKNILGPWTEPVLVQAGKGIIDPCPLWDEDGKVYLVHAFAGSRAGIKSILVAEELNKEGTKVISNEVMVYDGHKNDPTVEGPKFYKRNSYYYIFAPAGGVSTGWQIALRSKNVYGPYERKIVMVQGNTTINGPHQGAWITTTTGEDWFLHFQDKDAYGRVVHLQPMHWKNDWPVIGANENTNGAGEPVLQFKKPNVGKTFPQQAIPSSDEFNIGALGLQWQWQANPQPGWAFPTSTGSMRFFCIKQKDSLANNWLLPNMLLQKLPAEEFTATAKLDFTPAFTNDRIGFTIFGTDYAFISLVKKPDGVYVSYNTCVKADKNATAEEMLVKKLNNNSIYFKITVTNNAVCTFGFSEDGKTFEKINGNFKAMPGRWVGAKIGFFCTGTTITNDSGFADVDWIRFSKN